MKKRNEIKPEYKWDLSSYFKDEKSFLLELESVKKVTGKILEFEGKLNDKTNILKCLNFENEIGERISKLYVYSALLCRENGADSHVKELNEAVSSVAVVFSSNGSFVDVEISELAVDFIEKMITDESFYKYDNYLKEILRNKDHILSYKEEKLLSKMGEFAGGFSEVFNLYNDVNIKFEDALDSHGKAHKVNYSLQSIYAVSKDRELRKNSNREINGVFKQNIDFIAANYICSVKEDVYFSEIRNFPSTLYSALFGDEIPENVYYNLLGKVKENVKVVHSYLEQKRKILKLNKIANYDVNFPSVKVPTKKFTFEGAIELIKKAVSPLGEDYVNLIDKAKRERWIDVYPNDGKDAGAFSWGAYGANPVVLCNFVGNLESVFELAHELGHAIHTYLSNNNQVNTKADYSIFLAEIASTVNETLLVLYLFDLADSKDEKIYYIDYFLKNVRATIFRQTMFSEFEDFAHKKIEAKEPLSVKILTNEYDKLNKFYYGKKVELLDELKYEWARIPHFYNSYYVFKYASGLISAILMVKKILSEADMQEKYIKFLSAGSSLKPLEILKMAGVDLENSDSFDSAFEFIFEMLKKLKSLTK